MMARRVFFAALTLACLVGGWIALYRPRTAEPGAKSESPAETSSETPGGSAQALNGKLAPGGGRGTGGGGRDTAVKPELAATAAPTSAPARVQPAEPLTPEARAQAREERRKKARAGLEDFLRDELRMSEEQLQAYKDVQNKADAALKAAREADQGRAARRAAVRAANQEQVKELRELVGDVDYARIQDFQRRQREQYREEHPDSWDGRRGRGR